MAEIPHFSFPFRVATGGRIVAVDQDSPDEVAACVAALLCYPRGSRAAEDMPDFGIEELNFEQGGPDLGAIREAIAAYEPRASTLLDEEIENLVATVWVRLVDADQIPTGDDL